MNEISVILTVFNNEDYFQEAVTSVLEQDLPADEIIIVDDGSSSDFFRRAVQSLSGNSKPSIQYIYQHNQGVSAARNTGLANSKSPFIAFLDGDDIYSVNKLSLQLSLLSQLSEKYACISGASRRFLDGNPRISKIYTPTEEDGHIYNRLVERKARIPASPGATLFRRSALDEVGGFDTNLSINEDGDLLFRLAHRFEMKTHSEVVLQQRRRSGSLSMGESELLLKNSLKFIDKQALNNSGFPSGAFRRLRQAAYFNAAANSIFVYQDFPVFRKYIRTGVCEYGLPRSWRGWLAVIVANTGWAGRLIARLIRKIPKTLAFKWFGLVKDRQ